MFSVFGTLYFLVSFSIDTILPALFFYIFLHNSVKDQVFDKLFKPCIRYASYYYYINCLICIEIDMIAAFLSKVTLVVKQLHLEISANFFPKSTWKSLR